MKKQHEFATRAIHAGQEPDPSTGAVMTPIYATSTYVQQSPGKHKGYDYARSINPTRLAYEKCIADLESGTRGFAFASGLAAMATVLELLESGSHIVASDDLYGGTFRLFDRVRRRSANLDFTYVDLTDAKDLERAIKSNTRMVWIETPSNPLLKLIDLEAIGKIARERKVVPFVITHSQLRGSNVRLRPALTSWSIPQQNILTGILIWWEALLSSVITKNTLIKLHFCKIQSARSPARSTVFSSFAV
jgi:cystathionine beta-lyase/cystathionine gamma-synthase